MRRVRIEALKRKLWAFGTAAVVVAVDQATKAWAERALLSDPSRSIQVIPGILRLHGAENTGAAFSLFPGSGAFIPLVVVAAVILIVIAVHKSENEWEAISLGLVLGGALGNLIDRFARGPGLVDGSVVDWIEPSFFPTFNLADTAITVGVALLLILAMRRR